MRVLMMSADPRVKISGSESAARMADYAGLFDALHIIVLSRMHIARACRQAYALRGQYDVITAQGADETGLLAYVLSCMSGVPFQLQLHTDVMSPWYRRASWKERVRYVMARFLIPRASCLRVVSERIRRSLIESGIRNQESGITVVPIFTDVSKFTGAAPDPATKERFRQYDFKMVAVGRFVEREKNFCLLIDAMRLFVRICPQALLVIVGEGRDRRNYELRIMNYGLEKNVILEPWRDDLPSFLKSFDLFLLSSWYEGWGRAGIEAMAAGLPIVMTDVGLAGEIIKNQENGMIVPVGDARAFFHAVRELYEHPEKRKLFADAGRETVKNLKPAIRAEYLVRYRECMESCVANLDKNT